MNISLNKQSSSIQISVMMAVGQFLRLQSGQYQCQISTQLAADSCRNAGVNISV
jgi:hypothetical protein